MILNKRDQFVIAFEKGDYEVLSKLFEISYEEARYICCSAISCEDFLYEFNFYDRWKDINTLQKIV
jgi:hypothetical protein